MPVEGMLVLEPIFVADLPTEQYRRHTRNGNDQSSTHRAKKLFTAGINRKIINHNYTDSLDYQVRSG
jgi:hypothetical protein